MSFRPKKPSEVVGKKDRRDHFVDLGADAPLLELVKDVHKGWGYRRVSWLVAKKTMVTGVRVGQHRYIRVRPIISFRKRGMTQREVEGVIASVIDVATAIEEPDPVSRHGDYGP